MTFLSRNRSLHSIPHASSAWRYGTILAFLPCFYYVRLLSVMPKCLLFLSGAKNWNLMFTGALETSMIQITDRPFQNIWFLYTANFDLSTLHLSHLMEDSKLKVCSPKLTIDRYSCARGGGNDMLSLFSHFHSKGGTTLRRQVFGDIF